MRRYQKRFYRSLLILGLFIACLFFLSLYNFANTFADDSDPGAHYVTIYDQGEKLIVKTTATTVADVLAGAGITYDSSDTVEPSLTSIINADNFFINIYRSYPVLIIDGENIKHVMASGHDAKSIVAAAGITVYDGDTISSIKNPYFLETGIASAFSIVRNGGTTLTEVEEIAFEEQTIKDYNLAPGTSEVRQLGELGSKTNIYQVQTVNGKEISRTLVSSTVTREPVARITAVGASQIEMKPLTASMGRNRYTYTKDDGTIVERQETYYDLNMSRVMQYRLADGCGDGTYTVRDDGVKVDYEGYVLVAANLDRYPLCSVVETSLGLGKVYDTGTFASTNPEQFDIATDWTNRNGV